jgi:Ca2+-binding EF-hand superfamily protein
MNKITVLAALAAATFAVSAQAQRGPPQDPYGDATVSKTDASAAGAKRFAELDINMDGFLSEDELGRMARMMGQADTNGDGKLSAEEFAEMETSRFDMMDGNHDGQLTRAERDDFRQQMMARMQAMRAGGGGEGGD